MRALVIEDDDDVRAALRRALLLSGYEVLLAADGAEGLLKAGTEVPDVIVLDVGMPQMDGFQVCELLKADADLKDVPVIFLSAMDETIDKVRDRLNPSIELDGILATMYDSRTLHSREVLERVVQTFGDTVLETVIGRTVKFPDASVAGAPITSFAPDHSAAEAYRQLAKELIARGAVA